MSGLRFAFWMFYSALLVACGPNAYEQLVERGKVAERQKDWLEAARIYGEACQQKPSDKRVCARARELTDYAVRLGAHNARQKCAARDLGGCLDALRPVRNYGSREIDDVVAQAAGLAIEQCRPAAAADSEASRGIDELRCLQIYREDLWSDASFKAHFTSRARGTSEIFVALADREPATAAGARVSYLSAAACLAPLGPQPTELFRAAKGQFEARARVPLHIQFSVNGLTRDAVGSCNQVASALGRGLVCSPPTTGHQTPVIVGAEVYSLEPRWQRTYSDEQLSVRYQAGQETVTNPDYDRTRLEYELAEKRFSEIDSITLEREYRCKESGTKFDCDNYNATVDTYNTRQRERNNARDRFHSESPTLTQDVYRDHLYTRRSHRWVSPFRASLRVGEGLPHPEITEIVYEDAEQPGFPEAGLQADAFEPPGDTYFRDQGGSWLLSRIEARVRDELHARAEREAGGCASDGRLDCLTRAAYWMGEKNFGLWLIAGLASKPGANLPEPTCTASLL